MQGTPEIGLLKAKNAMAIEEFAIGTRSHRSRSAPRQNPKEMGVAELYWKEARLASAEHMGAGVGGCGSETVECLKNSAGQPTSESPVRIDSSQRELVSSHTPEATAGIDTVREIKP